jgi:LuxR family transcriptional regulator, maltose regulon positive regulatory protein
MGTKVKSARAAGGTGSPVLVTTKVNAPSPRRELVLRPLLVERLVAGSQLKLTLLAAPAGWGKTTILAEWLAHDRPRRFAWLSVDRGDNDPGRFWSYVVVALQTVDPGLGASALAQLRASGTSIVDVVLPALINEIADRAEPIVLVLDDFHVITTPEVHEQLTFLIDNLPQSLHLAVATRSDPPLALARRRAQGEVNEIRADELQFSEEETASLLNQVLGLGLDSADVARLRRRTEGWAAGLYLAALSLRGQPDPRGFIQAFAGDDRHIVDYLGAEVLAGQEQDVQAFLLQTSILDRLCGPLCDTVTEGSGSAGMLERIERSNLFVRSLDAKREWYRYHRLFSELLHHELRRRSPDLVPTLHRRASAWHRRHGSVREAIGHAIAGGDDAEAAELVAEHWNAFFNQGRLTTVSDWLDALPAETVLADPRLAIARAWIALDLGRLDEVERWIEAAAESSSDESALADVSVVYSFKAGDLGGASDAAREALALQPEGESFGRTVALLLLGATRYWSERPREAIEALDEAAALARAMDNHLGHIYALGYLAMARLDLGEVAEAEKLTRQALDVADDPGRREHFVAMIAHLAESRFLAQAGRLDDACAAAARAAVLAKRGAGRIELAYAFIQLAGLQRETGDRAGARDALAEALRSAENAPDLGKVEQLLRGTERRLTVGRARRAPGEELPGDELSERELTVLRLLPTRLSQREIGESLYVSVNTVKTHMKSIFRKLDVSTREDAVAKARELGLV